jgi:hypothetical protein
MAHCRSGRVARRPVHWVPRPGGRPRGAYRRQYRAACCCEDKRTCWTRGQCGNARGQCGLGGSYLNQVYRRDDHGVFVIHTVLEVPPRRCVHPAAHPPRLSTAAAHPAPEPHREEPPPTAARNRWSRCRACAERRSARDYRHLTLVDNGLGRVNSVSERGRSRLLASLFARFSQAHQADLSTVKNRAENTAAISCHIRNNSPSTQATS